MSGGSGCQNWQSGSRRSCIENSQTRYCSLSYYFLLQIWSLCTFHGTKVNLALCVFRHSGCLILVLFEQNDYYNMMKGPIEPHLQFAIRTLSAQNQQIQQNLQNSRETTSSSGTMIPVKKIDITFQKLTRTKLYAILNPWGEHHYQHHGC